MLLIILSVLSLSPQDWYQRALLIHAHSTYTRITTRNTFDEHNLRCVTWAIIYLANLYSFILPLQDVRAYQINVMYFGRSLHISTPHTYIFIHIRSTVAWITCPMKLKPASKCKHMILSLLQFLFWLEKWRCLVLCGAPHKLNVCFNIFPFCLHVA